MIQSKTNAVVNRFVIASGAHVHTHVKQWH
jgi:hypothetical protein